MRTHYCGELSAALVGRSVTLCGWAHRRRDHGGVIFIDLRDRGGLAQIVCHPDRAAAFQSAERVRGEYVLRITGTPGGDVVNHVPPDCLSVYVPTTPNPTGGYFVIVRRSDVIELDMTVDQALKYIISMGVVPPQK